MTATSDPPAAPSPPSPDFRDDGWAVHYVKYYFVFYTRRRRPFFADAAANARVEKLMRATAAGLACEITFLRAYPSVVVVHVEASPMLSPNVIATRLREDVAGPLKEEFESIRRTGAVFVRRYLVTTVPVAETGGEAFEGRVSSQ
ncbi:MAG: transposase [Rhodothermales bacterium]